ncbi:hypothetical protein GR183_01615 [Stappia sp. GBMRC 2046]|uniref:Uncharacterized protein n=1 Tax=Stappia sediminis TaxID=2692190 RepID=A0A7X3S603_9HYPH|nr:hypothetical protein [Stappia sediminis]MXN63587.1 hypothetical protein [Stappia sediminis]
MRVTAAELKRIATVPPGAEIEGLFVHGGDLLNDFARASFGVISSADFNAAEIAPPKNVHSEIDETARRCRCVSIDICTTFALTGKPQLSLSPGL